MSKDTHLGFAPSFELDQKGFKEMTKESLEKFISSSLVRATPANMYSSCVDGRKGVPEDNFPVISYAGGDAGKVANLFAAINSLGLQDKVSNDRALELVIESVGGIGNFRFHTDEKAENEHAACGMGCGHLRMTKENFEQYGLTENQQKFLFEEKLPMLLKQNAKQDVLLGKHLESAVVIIESEFYGLKHYMESPDGMQQVFVYQKTFHDQQLNQLAKLLMSELGPETPLSFEQVLEALNDAYGIQSSLTLTELAVGLPYYKVNISEQSGIEITAY